MFNNFNHNPHDGLIAMMRLIHFDILTYNNHQKLESVSFLTRGNSLEKNSYAFMKNRTKSKNRIKIEKKIEKSLKNRKKKSKNRIKIAKMVNSKKIAKKKRKKIAVKRTKIEKSVVLVIIIIINLLIEGSYKYSDQMVAQSFKVESFISQFRHESIICAKIEFLTKKIRNYRF